MAPGDNDDGYDEHLFRRVLADAEPLKRRRSRPSDGSPNPIPNTSIKKRVSANPVAAFKPVTQPAPPPELAAGDYAGVDRRTADRFRRGKLSIEARLDLHGLHQDAAHGALAHFITESAVHGKRCVLVITGRGSREGSGILRERLPQWLNQPPVRGYVLAFTTARPQHGRDGAFYVLLKRKRGDKS